MRRSQYGLLLVIALLAMPSVSHAQVSELGAHYFGNNVWNKGLSLSANKLKSTDSVNCLFHKRQKWIEKNHQLTLGFYNDQDAYSALFVNVGFYKKRHRTKRWIYLTELKPIGLYRSFLPNTYEINEAGNVSKVTLPGRLYYAPSASLGLGRYTKKHPKNYWHADANMMVLLPYNTYVMPLVNLQIGYNFSLAK